MKTSLRNAVKVPRGGAGGGGGGVVPRVATDSHTLICYYDLPVGSLVDSTSCWPNTGTGGMLPLTCYGAQYAIHNGWAAGARASGNFGEGCFFPGSIDHSGAGGMLASGATTLDDATDLSVSGWFDIPALPAAPPDALLVGAQAGTGSWSTPFAKHGVWVTADAQASLGVAYAAGSGLSVVSDYDLLLPGRHHVGYTISATTAKLYIDGALVGTGTLTSARLTGTGRVLISGMPVAGAGSPRFSNGVAGDVRFENTIRDAAWFASVESTRRSA